MKCRFLLSIVCLISGALTLCATEPALVIDSGGNTRYVRKVIFTKDGAQLVSVGDERVIRVWDLKSGHSVRAIRDQVGPCGNCFIGDIALSPDNTYLAVGGKFPGSTDQERFAIRIYNFQTGEPVRQLKGHQARVSVLAFSADGKQLASGSDYFAKEDRSRTDAPVRVWKLDAQGWEPSLSLRAHEQAVSSLAFSADGKRLASGGTEGALFLYELNPATTQPGESLKKHFDAIYGLAFLPDGRLLSAGLDRRINVWDKEGEFVKQLSELPSGIRSMDLSSDNERSRLVVGLDDGSARIVSLSDGSVIKTFKRDRDQVRAVAFSGADKNLVASTGGFNGEIWVWNADSGQSVLNGVLSGRGRTIWSVGFSKDGNSIAFGTERYPTEHYSDEPNNYGPLQQAIEFRSGYNPTAQLVTKSDYQISLGGKLFGDHYSAITKVGEYELRTRYGEVLKKGVAPNVFIDEPIRLTDLLIMRNKQQVNSISRDSETGRTHLCYTFTHDGRYIISGGEGGYLAVYDTKNPRNPIHRFYGHTNDVWSVAASPDGRFIISGSSDQTIKVWDIKSENYVLSIFVAADREWIAWTPQGYYTSSFSGDKYIGWQVESENNLRPEFYKAEQFSKLFYRPDVISQFLATLDIQTAVEQAGPPKSALGFWSKIQTTVGATDVMDNLPPQIEILDPVDNLNVSDRLLKVKIRVTSNNLPITNVQISLNGFQKATFRGVPDDSERGRKVEIEMTVALRPEANTLVVYASHEVAKSQPQMRTIYFKPLNEKPEQKIPDRAPAAHAYFSRVSYSTKDFTNFGRAIPMPAQPTIRILEPEESPNPTSISAESLLLRVLVPSSTEGQEVKVKILLNGREWHKQDIQPGLDTPINIALDEDGLYTITAISIVDGVESAPQTRRIKYVNPKPSTPNLFFLGIGIKGYKNLQPGLEYADMDAAALGQLLENLKDSALFKKVEKRLLPNDQATRVNILKGIEWLNKNAVHDNDVRVVLFSGHGGVFGAPPKPQYYFYVQDQILDEDPEIQSPNWGAIVTRLLNQSGRGPVLLFVDTCRAGAATPKEFMDLSNGLVFFGASGANQKANENSAWGHGAFTEAVLEGLSGCADTSSVGRPADGMIDFMELGLFVKRRVKELNESQTAAFEFAGGLDPFNISLRSPSGPNCPPSPNQ